MTADSRWACSPITALRHFGQWHRIRAASRFAHGYQLRTTTTTLASMKSPSIPDQLNSVSRCLALAATKLDWK